MAKDVIIALDFPSAEEALHFLDSFGDERPYVKVGMELFYSAGADFVRKLKERGHSIFLDLKLCDIPNTVCGAMRSLAPLGADIINVHAFGSSAMLTAALEGLTLPNGERHTKLIAVTILTSIDEDTLHSELMIPRPLQESVMDFAALARSSKLDGVVCSPLEAGAVHSRCGSDFITVTPGVRFAENDRGDQSRVTSPAQARALGSDYIVVGRPITRAADPVAAWRRCREEFLGGISE